MEYIAMNFTDRCHWEVHRSSCQRRARHRKQQTQREPADRHHRTAFMAASAQGHPGEGKGLKALIST
jgi:hypothetical protein